MDSSPLLGGASGDPRRQKIIIVIITSLIVVVAIAATAGITAAVTKSNNNNNNNNNNPPSQCPPTKYSIQYDSFYPYSTVSYVFRQASTGHLIKNATIWTGTGIVLVGYDILMNNGKIVSVASNISPPPNTNVTNVHGAYVTPGLVDMHSHLGVYSYPEDSFGTQDGNELTDPTTPYVRAVDALDPEDPAIPGIRQGGVTTSQVLPGSGNVMGGEAVYVKLKGKTVSNMLIPNVPRSFKMACGENPKRVYGEKGVMPESRMGSAYIMRQQFYNAAVMKQQQELWDCQNASGVVTDNRPFDLKLDPLIAILSGQAVLNVHCYEVEDLEMMIRMSKEFNFQIAAFHHALEAWKIPDILRANNIAVAIFSDHWGFKMEGFDGSVHAPAILYNAGVKMALKSGLKIPPRDLLDHPVLYARYLILEAAIAHYFGLPEQAAIQSVTTVPATVIGLGNRIGTIEVGKEGDVVVWDRYPLDLGATANMVFIDGNLIDNNNLPLQPPKITPTQASLQISGPNQCGISNNYAIVGVTIYTLNASDSVITNGQIYVENGIIQCVSVTCTIPLGTTTYTLNGGIVTPGFISTGSPIGLVEVESEFSSKDGTLSDIDSSTVRALDGIMFNVMTSRHVTEPWAAGVTTAIVGPVSSGLISGVGVAFNTISKADQIRGTVVDQVIVSPQTSLHVNIGNSFKSKTPSISSQISNLRKLFVNSTNPIIQSAMSGAIPVVVTVDQADQIASIVRLKKDLGFNLVIVGGAESHIVANLLSTAGVPVILNPFMAAPNTFETWRNSDNIANILRQAGVKIGFAVSDLGRTRNLRWEAGAAVGKGLDFYDALKGITRNIAEMFQIQSTGTGSIIPGTKANFVGFSANPLSFDGRVQFVAVNNEVDCTPSNF